MIRMAETTSSPVMYEADFCGGIAVSELPAARVWLFPLRPHDAQQAPVRTSIVISGPSKASVMRFITLYTRSSKDIKSSKM